MICQFALIDCTRSLILQVSCVIRAGVERPDAFELEASINRCEDSCTLLRASAVAEHLGMGGMQPAVVLLSGGLDSATVLAVARSQGYACHALSFDYGQRHRHELEAAARVRQRWALSSTGCASSTCVCSADRR